METKIGPQFRDPPAEELLSLSNRIIYELTRSKELKKELPQILKNLAQGLRADLALVAIFSESEKGPKILGPPHLKEEKFGFKDLPPGWKERLKRNKIVWSRGEKGLREKLKVENLLLVPIFEKEAWRGFLALGNKKPRPQWSPQVLNILNSITHVIGSSLYQERLEKIKAQRENLIRATVTSRELAHHFKNLLQIILAQAERGLKSPFEKEKNQALKRILKTTEEAAEISTGVMDHPWEENISLASLLKELVSQYQEISPAEIILELEVKSTPLVKASFPLLREAFRELLVNSLKALGKRGTIGICLEKRGDEALVIIKDSGPGIPQKHKQKIFENGFSTRESKGLGLSGVKRYIEQLGGKIELGDSSLGASFEICLPTYMEAQSESTKEISGKEKVIVLVEDEIFIRKTLEETLEEKGYLVKAFGSYQEALRTAKNLPRLDLLITDISLPDGKGTKLARLLKERFPKLRVLFISGFPLEIEENTEHAFLKKPFSCNELLTSVKKLLT